MLKKNGLLFAYYLDHNKGHRKLSWDELNTNEELGQNLWVHFNYMSKEVKKWLQTKIGMSQNTLDSFTQKNIRPRTIVYPDGILTCLRSLNIDKQEDEEDMVSIRLYYREGLIITARDRRVGFMEQIAKALDLNNGPDTGSDLLIQCIETMTNNIVEHVNELCENVDDLEANVLENKDPLNQTELVNILRAILFLRRHLAPQREALKALSSTTSPLFSPTQKASLQESADKTIRVLEELELSRDRSHLLQEKENTRISNEVNKRMYLFSLITAIFFPITTIASLFGMNLGGIPGANASWAFTTTSIVLFMTSFLWVLILKIKKWF